MSSKFIVFVEVTFAISCESNLPSLDCKVLNIELYVFSEPATTSTDWKFVLAGWLNGNSLISSLNKFVPLLLAAALTISAHDVKFISSFGLFSNK